MSTLDFDPDRVRALGTSLDTAAYTVSSADVDGNTDLLKADLAGALTTSMCEMVSGLARDALTTVQKDFLAVSAVTLHAVSEFTGKDESIATSIAKAGEGVR